MQYISLHYIIIVQWFGLLYFKRPWLIQIVLRYCKQWFAMFWDFKGFWVVWPPPSIYLVVAMWFYEKVIRFQKQNKNWLALTSQRTIRWGFPCLTLFKNRDEEESESSHICSHLSNYYVASPLPGRLPYALFWPRSNVIFVPNTSMLLGIHPVPFWLQWARPFYAL